MTCSALALMAFATALVDDESWKKLANMWSMLFMLITVDDEAMAAAAP